MSLQDKTLECSDCAHTFTFGIEEQEQFQSRGHIHEPKRCPQCRQTRKAKQNGNSGNSYENGGYGYKPRRQQFPAVCADCGKETTVPFEPSQGRSVYCSDCFRKVRLTR